MRLLSDWPALASRDLRHPVPDNGRASHGGTKPEKFCIAARALLYRDICGLKRMNLGRGLFLLASEIVLIDKG